MLSNEGHVKDIPVLVGSKEIFFNDFLCIEYVYSQSDFQWSVSEQHED